MFTDTGIYYDDVDDVIRITIGFFTPIIIHLDELSDYNCTEWAQGNIIIDLYERKKESNRVE